MLLKWEQASGEDLTVSGEEMPACDVKFICFQSMALESPSQTLSGMQDLVALLREKNFMVT